MLTLYDATLSANCYKVRLFCALLGQPIELAPIDLLAKDQKSTGHLQRNPFGQVPVLVDDGLTLRDSQAILVYLARTYADEQWLPNDAEGLARVAQWLSCASNEIWSGPARARACRRFGRDGYDAAAANAQAFLPVLDAHLGSRQWLELDRPTIADIACYPYVALAPEGDISLEPYAAIRAWCGRVQALPNYLPMPGLPLNG